MVDDDGAAVTWEEGGVGEAGDRRGGEGGKVSSNRCTGGW